MVSAVEQYITVTCSTACLFDHSCFMENIHNCEPDQTEDKSMSFSDLLDKYRQQSFSERDKGTRFERLIKEYLQTAPQYQTLFREVWLWTEFPYRKDFGSGKDTGIDLVALTNSGDFWAVQCKCYDPNTQITKADVDTFLSTSEKRFRNESMEQGGFRHRLWGSTSKN